MDITMASRQTSGPSTTISLRISESNLARIDAARSITNDNRTDFLLSDALQRADQLLLDHTRIALDAEAFQCALDELDSHELPTPELIALMHKRASWE